MAVAAVSAVDDRGATVTLPGPAARIVALAPHLAEIVHAAGAGARLVGVVRYSDFPAEVSALPQVGDAARVNAERVLQLRPDLILGWRSGNQAADLEQLERLGYAVFVTEARRLADIPQLLLAVGKLSGTSDAAARAAVNFNNKIQYLRISYADRTAVPVFYEIWHRPLITISGAHMINDVIETCGGRNVFAREPGLTPTVSLEALLSARPSAIIGGTSADVDDAFAARWRAVAVEALRELPAYHVPPDAIQRATPRIAEGARAICGHIEAVRRNALARDHPVRMR